MVFQDQVSLKWWEKAKPLPSKQTVEDKGKIMMSDAKRLPEPSSERTTGFLGADCVPNLATGVQSCCKPWAASRQS